MVDDYIYKVILVGNSGVGKTCMVAHYLENQVPWTYVQTKEKNVSERCIQTKKGKITLKIWDLSGDEIYRTITAAHYFNSHGAIIAYSMSDSSSLQNVKDWFSNIKRTLNGAVNDSLPTIVVGLKSDSKKCCVTETQGEAVASALGCKHFIGSCHKPSSFNQMFNLLTTEMLERTMVNEKRLKNKHSEIAANENEPLLKSSIKVKNDNMEPSICDCGCTII